MNDVKRINTYSNVSNTVVKIAETSSTLSRISSDKYLKNVIRESNSLLEKLSAFPNINEYRRIHK